MKLIVIIVSLFFVLPPQNVEGSSAAGQETLIGITGRDFILMGADSSLSSSITLTSRNVDKIKVIANPFPSGKKSMDHVYMANNMSTRHDQQVIAVASAGDTADSERLVGSLSAQVKQMEFESILGSDVVCIFDGMKDSSVDSKPNDGGTNIAMNSLLTRSPCLDAKSVAFLARGQIADALRSRNRFNTCVLIGGMVPLQKRHGHEMEGVSSFSERVQEQVQATTGEATDNKNISNLIKSDDTQNNPFEPNLFWLDEYGSLQQIEYGAHGLGSNFILSILDRKYSKNLTQEEGVRLLKDCFEQLRTRYIINCPESPCIKCIDNNGCRIIT